MPVDRPDALTLWKAVAWGAATLGGLAVLVLLAQVVRDSARWFRDEFQAIETFKERHTKQRKP